MRRICLRDEEIGHVACLRVWWVEWCRQPYWQPPLPNSYQKGRGDASCRCLRGTVVFASCQPRLVSLSRLDWQYQTFTPHALHSCANATIFPILIRHTAYYRTINAIFSIGKMRNPKHENIPEWCLFPAIRALRVFVDSSLLTRSLGSSSSCSVRARRRSPRHPSLVSFLHHIVPLEYHPRCKSENRKLTGTRAQACPTAPTF